MRLALALGSIEFPVMIVMHSLPFATSVSKNAQIKVKLLPGRLIPKERLTVGTNTLRAINKFSAHKAIVGASGINGRGLYELLESGEVYAAMIDRAEEALLLINSTKFGAAALSQYSSWSSKMTLITDRMPDNEIRSAVHKASVPIVIVGEA
jgi:DeoR/GlpR family transcriptional regulator of sugar metabolism